LARARNDREEGEVPKRQGREPEKNVQKSKFRNGKSENPKRIRSSRAEAKQQGREPNRNLRKSKFRKDQGDRNEREEVNIPIR
jgi:hypothetical protein